MLKKNDVIELDITAVTNEGNGVGRHEGVAVFVPLAAPGDRLKVLIVKTQASFCYGKILEVLTPASCRVDPECPVFGRCGGCTLRHISYEEELAQKQEWVRQNLLRIGGIDLPMPPIIGSPRTGRYRNKVQLPFGMEDGRVVSGFYSLRSHRLAACDDCLIQPAIFNDIAAAVKEYAQEHQVEIYDETTHKGLLRNLFMRVAEATGEVMVCPVVTSPALPNPEALIQKIRAACPQTVSIVLNINPDKTNVLLGSRCKTLWGKGHITDRLCGLEVEISPLAFYQVNREATQLLYGKAAEFAALTGGELLVDLYCGTGTIGLSMAHQARELIGVEVVPQAVENARLNAKHNGIDNARFICADAGQAATQLAEQDLRPDVVLLDPPRKGCDLPTIDAVCAMQPQRVVMVSCNSATAARDVKLFSQRGYEAKAVQAVDLFPKTAHVECVVLMSRAKE